ncbi:MAG: UDP-glucose 4-epimerase GalE [bacterium]
MKVLVAGGAGYIGSHVVKMLGEKGYFIIVVDDLSQGKKEHVLYGEFIQGNIGDINLMERIFQENQIEFVIYFAANTSVEESIKNPNKYYRNNVVNCLNFLDSMIKHNVKKIIFSSTAVVYGIPEEIPIKENEKTKPINPYGKTKLIIEQILEDFDKAYGLKYIALRYFNVAGAEPSGKIGENHNPETHLIPKILKSLSGSAKNVPSFETGMDWHNNNIFSLQRRSPSIYGVVDSLEKREIFEIYGDDYLTKDGTCIRDYIYVNDVAQAHILALEYLLNKNCESKIYNLGSEKGFSVKEIIDKVEKVTKKKVLVKITSRREGDIPVLIASSEKIKKELGWKRQCEDIEFIIKTSWQWFLKKL